MWLDVNGRCGLGGPGWEGAVSFPELGPGADWTAGHIIPLCEGVLTPLSPAPAWPLCQGLRKECGVPCLRAWF